MKVSNTKEALEKMGINRDAYAINMAEYPNDAYRRLIRSMRLLSEMDKQDATEKGKAK